MTSDKAICRRKALQNLGRCAAAFLSGTATSFAKQDASTPSSKTDVKRLRPLLLSADSFKTYVDYFNGMVPEEVINYVPNAQAWGWMRDNIPYFSCPDRQLEETYYYRWWTYRKHIEQTPKGFIVTEFLKPVKHATEFNAISCAFGHHVAEGRWIHDRRIIDEYTSFWLKSGENGGLQQKFHQFSGWASGASYQRWLVTGDTRFLLSLYEALRLDYKTWQRDRQAADGLFWQADVADGMESSISGGRKVKNLRPTINSYMYANARALSAIAHLGGDHSAARLYSSDASKLRSLVQEKLWNAQAKFFETLLETGKFADVREEIGFTPWAFNLPEVDARYNAAWKQLMDPNGFYAPYGLTTAEQRDPRCESRSAGMIASGTARRGRSQPVSPYARSRIY